MDFGIATYGLGYLAGILSTLSPCVLPLVPIVLISAASTHRLGPFALACGLALSFATVGMFVATVGVSLGLGAGLLRNAAAVILILIGIVLMSGALQARFASAAAGVGQAGQTALSGMNVSGLRGQLAIGLLLGIVWSPCVGPTLGAASVLASQGKDLFSAAMVMALFGLGAATPLLALGSRSRARMNRLRGRLLLTGQYGKPLLGFAMIAFGLFVLAGVDKSVEAWFVDALPDWLGDITTRY